MKQLSLIACYLPILLQERDQALVRTSLGVFGYLYHTDSGIARSFKGEGARPHAPAVA